MIDFLLFCKDNHIPYLESGHHHCHTGWVQTHCPFCAGGRQGWHLGFSLEGGGFNCWRCGALSVWDVMGALLNTSRKDIIGRALLHYKKGGQKRPIEKKVVPRSRKIKPPLDCGPLTLPHKKYLEKRGFDFNTLVKEWDIKATHHLSGVWSWRIIIPIHNAEGAIVAYQGRAIQEDTKPKYRMSEDKDILVDPKSLLYGIEKAQEDYIVIVEGVPGVWRLGPGAVATFGIDWKPQQANILRQYKTRYILFDPEPKAQEKAMQLAEWLSFYPGTTEILEGFRTDPGDFSVGQVKRIRRELGITA